ncbi:DNA-directed RNA polymerase subunit K [archaeon]|nr:DNA-directed RNA polymerase subunit K [archaeon]
MKLTRYEKARIIGARALQLSMGAPTLIKIKGDFAEPLAIALEELKEGVIPITVRRNMPIKRETGEAEIMAGEAAIAGEDDK